MRAALTDLQLSASPTIPSQGAVANLGHLEAVGFPTQRTAESRIAAGSCLVPRTDDLVFVDFELV